MLLRRGLHWHNVEETFIYPVSQEVQVVLLVHVAQLRMNVPHNVQIPD